MARLQDFPSVTPTDSDKLLVVQSQGQGLATFGSTLGAKMDKANPTGTGKLSMNRKDNTTEGNNSVALGTDGTASGNHSLAEGYQTTASGSGSHSDGVGTIANHLAQHAFGSYNVADTSTAANTARGNYIEIVGKGTENANRSNARTLDWSGNEVLAGGLKINNNETITALKQSSVTLSKTATDGQYVSDLDFFTYRITNAWLVGENALIITRPSLQNKVVFNIFRGFQPITDNSITVNFFYF